MHPELAGIGGRDGERILKRAGFELKKQTGSHKHYTGVVNGRKRKVAVAVGQERFAPKTLQSMIRQSGLSEDEWLALKQEFVAIA